MVAGNRPTETALLKTVDDLYAAALNPQDWPQALDSVGALSGACGVTFFPLSGDPASLSYVSAGIAEAANEYFTQWLDRCPRVAVDRRAPINDRVVWDGDFVDAETIGKHAYFNDYAHSYDLRFSIMRSSTALHPDSRYVLTAPFSWANGAPSAAQIEFFSILSGHAVRALQMYRRMGFANPADNGLSGLLNHQSHGVVVQDTMGRVVHCNDAMRRLQGDGISIHRDRLVTTLRADQMAFDSMVGEALWPSVQGGRLHPIGLRRPDRKKPLLAQAIPLKISDSLPLGAVLRVQAGAVILFVDPDADGPAASVESLKLLGLTTAEVRVAQILGLGAGPETVSLELALSVGTVRNHMKRIFDKLGIGRQSELVALMGKLTVLNGPFQ